MELWIRSQDKKRLIKIDNIKVYEDLKDNYSDIRAVFNDYELSLGEYKTKERALMILDEIQNILQPRIIMREPEIDYDDMINSLTDGIALKTTQKIDMELKEAGQVVYQMPEE